MGSISDHTDVTHDVESTLESTAPKELELNGDEIKFLLESSIILFLLLAPEMGEVGSC